MKKLLKISSVFILLIFIFSLSSCVYSKEYKETTTDAIILAKEYIKNKYHEELSIDDTSTDSEIGYGLPAPPSGAVRIYDKNNNYSVYVNIKKNIIADDKQLNEIKDDIKNTFLTNELMNLEHTIIDFKVFGINPYILAQPSTLGEYFDETMYYTGDIMDFITKNNLGIQLDIHFKAAETLTAENQLVTTEKYKDKFSDMITKINDTFKGNNSHISMFLYKPDRYMNSDVKEIIDPNRNIASIWDRYIYSSNYLYLKAFSEMGSNYDNQTNTSTPTGWTTEFIYDKYIEVDDGLYASSCQGIQFNDINYLVHYTYPVYTLVENTTVIDKNTFEIVVDEDLVNKYKENNIGQTVLSDIYYFAYNPQLFTNKDRDINIKINKSLFKNGILLKPNVKIGSIYADDELGFKIYPLNYGFIEEDDQYLYLTLDSDNKIIVYTE